VDSVLFYRPKEETTATNENSSPKDDLDVSKLNETFSSKTKTARTTRRAWEKLSLVKAIWHKVFNADSHEVEAIFHHSVHRLLRLRYNITEELHGKENLTNMAETFNAWLNHSKTRILNEMFDIATERRKGPISVDRWHSSPSTLSLAEYTNKVEKSVQSVWQKELGVNAELFDVELTQRVKYALQEFFNKYGDGRLPPNFSDEQFQLVTLAARIGELEDMVNLTSRSQKNEKFTVYALDPLRITAPEATWMLDDEAIQAMEKQLGHKISIPKDLYALREMLRLGETIPQSIEEPQSQVASCPCISCGKAKVQAKSEQIQQPASQFQHILSKSASLVSSNPLKLDTPVFFPENFECSPPLPPVTEVFRDQEASSSEQVKAHIEKLFSQQINQRNLYTKSLPQEMVYDEPYSNQLFIPSETTTGIAHGLEKAEEEVKKLQESTEELFAHHEFLFQANLKRAQALNSIQGVIKLSDTLAQTRLEIVEKLIRELKVPVLNRQQEGNATSQWSSQKEFKSPSELATLFFPGSDSGSPHKHAIVEDEAVYTPFESQTSRTYPASFFSGEKVQAVTGLSDPQSISATDLRSSSPQTINDSSELDDHDGSS
jgi:hypothetical protein